MIAPTVPLRLLAQMEHPELTDKSREAKAHALEVALKNCEATAAFGTDQQTLVHDQDLHEDILKMRAEALAAIQAGKAAARSVSLEDFNRLETEFWAHYGSLISSVKAYLWDSGGHSKKCLWPLVEEVM